MKRIVNGLYVTECISYPRSGHNLLVEILGYYFGDRFAYRNIYDNPELALSKDPTGNYQKNHDFDLATPITPDHNYLVQIRCPIAAMDSWRDFALDAGDGEKTKESYRQFISQAARFWPGFIDKWVLSDVPNRLIVSYEDLIENTYRVVNRVVWFIDATRKPDDGNVIHAIEKARIRPNRHHEFKYCELA